MKTIPISELEGSIDTLLAAGLDEPVELTREGIVVGYFVSCSCAELIDEVLLLQKAASARAEGFIGIEATKALLDKFRDTFALQPQ